MSRLTLSMVGIKSPLDIDGDPTAQQPSEAPVAPTKIAAAAAQTPAPEKSRTRPATRGPKVADPLPAAPSPFYGKGRPIQTSMAIDQTYSDRLDELARATGASLNSLAIAAIHAGLPASVEPACELIVAERVGRAGSRHARIERNLRLPHQLRARVDELVAGARTRLPRGTRADIINGALHRALPVDFAAATELIITHARRVEQAAAES
jgi:hypothetical protein